MRKFLVFALLFLVLLNSAYAASFEVKVTSIKDKIVVDEVAEFEVSIQNNLDSDEEFVIKKAGYPFWDMYITPLQNPITLKVPARGTASIKLFVDPLYITSVDTYTLEMGVALERRGEEQKVPVTIGIKSTEPLISGYIPTVLGSISITPEKIDPREDFTIKVVLNNQNPINYSNLTVKIESSLFKDELYVPLGPKEEKTIEVTKKLDDMAFPQENKMVVAVFLASRVIVDPIIKEFEIIEYTKQEELKKEQSFLRIRKGLKINSNNPNYNGAVRIETNSFRILLSRTFPRADVEKEKDKVYFAWRVVLDKNNSMTVYVTENYRPIVVILALAIVAIILYFVFRSPIVVRKSIANVTMSEGGISDAKVVVRIKNRSGTQLSNIEVIDNAPHIAHVEKELTIGSMQPHAILQHPKRGVIIKWTLEILEPGDERVLSYKMKSRLPILGELNLPAATARCSVGNKVVISNSNRVTVNG